jgi:hypothetical protein
METAGIARACNSFWEEAGTGTGATGAEGASGLVQHSGDWQSLQSPQHEPATEVLGAAASGDTAMAELAARTNPSNNAIAILVSLSAMPALSCRLKRNGIQTIAEHPPDARFFFPVHTASRRGGTGRNLKLAGGPRLRVQSWSYEQYSCVDDHHI